MDDLVSLLNVSFNYCVLLALYHSVISDKRLYITLNDSSPIVFLLYDVTSVAEIVPESSTVILNFLPLEDFICNTFIPSTCIDSPPFGTKTNRAGADPSDAEDLSTRQ